MLKHLKIYIDLKNKSKNNDKDIYLFRIFNKFFIFIYKGKNIKYIRNKKILKRYAEVTKYSRGHKVYGFYNCTSWFYFDNNKIFDNSRPCKKCGEYPTEEGYDACLGELKGVKYACCGHGDKNKSYMI